MNWLSSRISSRSNSSSSIQFEKMLCHLSTNGEFKEEKQVWNFWLLWNALSNAEKINLLSSVWNKLAREIPGSRNTS